MAQVFVAKQSAVTTFDGRNITIRRGVTRVEQGHELLERLPHLFEPVEASIQYRAPGVETARQEPTAPKTRRGGRRTKKATEPAPTPPPEPAPDTTAEAAQEPPETGASDDDAADTPQAAQEPAKASEDGKEPAATSEDE